MPRAEGSPTTRRRSRRRWHRAAVAAPPSPRDGAAGRGVSLFEQLMRSAESRPAGRPADGAATAAAFASRPVSPHHTPHEARRTPSSRARRTVPYTVCSVVYHCAVHSQSVSQPLIVVVVVRRAVSRSSVAVRFGPISFSTIAAARSSPVNTGSRTHIRSRVGPSPVVSRPAHERRYCFFFFLIFFFVVTFEYEKKIFSRSSLCFFDSTEEEEYNTIAFSRYRNRRNRNILSFPSAITSKLFSTIQS